MSVAAIPAFAYRIAKRAKVEPRNGPAKAVRHAVLNPILLWMALFRFLNCLEIKAIIIKPTNHTLMRLNYEERGMALSICVK